MKFGAGEIVGGSGQSLSLRRAWIEMLSSTAARISLAGRSPYGERGLKYFAVLSFVGNYSRSPYGERGLKCKPGIREETSVCRSPYGERGLKCSPPSCQRSFPGRSPYGERGLKSHQEGVKMIVFPVALLTESVD